MPTTPVKPPARGRSASPRSNAKTPAAKSAKATPTKQPKPTGSRSSTPAKRSPPAGSPSKKPAAAKAAGATKKSPPGGTKKPPLAPPLAKPLRSAAASKELSADSLRSAASNATVDDEAAAAKIAALPAALASWVKPKAGKVAVTYAARINALFSGQQRSVGELLFLTEPADLAVGIDAAHDHSTLSALQIMRLVEVTAIKRPGARRPPDVEPATKVQMGDELVLRALPHVLASVAVPKQGKVVLAAKHARDKLARQVKNERAALLGAAEALQRRVLPLVRLKLSAVREKNKVQRAATRLQSAWRGKLRRREISPMVDAQRARKRAAKLRSKKLLAGLVNQVHHEPVYTETRLEREEEAERFAEAQARRQEWRQAHPVVASWYESASVTSKAHSGSLNKTLAAAPEAAKKKLSARRLAKSPLNLLFSHGVEATALVDQSGNNLTVNCSNYPGGSPDHFHSRLNLDTAVNVTRATPGHSQWRLKFTNISTTRNGRGVDVEGFNTTEYRPAAPRAVGIRGRYSILQVNLDPIFDLSGSFQPFQQALLEHGFSTSDPEYAMVDASSSNMVSFWYRFTDTVTGAPLELEEFTLSFFDFDQDWADGDKAYVRESIVLSDFAVAYVTGSDQVETTFSDVLVRDVTGLDAAGVPNSWLMSRRPGVVARSTTQGSGPARPIKPEWQLCQGACLQSPPCNMRQLTTAHSPRSAFYWSGCGFSDNAAGTPINASSGPYLNANGQSVACALDCPRTHVSFDDGNPTNPHVLTDQQRDRGVSFLFRNRMNFSFFLRTEVGAAARGNTANSLYNRAGAGPNLDPIVGRGRHFLMAGASAIEPLGCPVG